jgi:hypothetical protein
MQDVLCKIHIFKSLPLVCVFLITSLCACGHLTVHSTSTAAAFQCSRGNKQNLLNLYKNIFREFHSGFDMMSE